MYIKLRQVRDLHSSLINEALNLEDSRYCLRYHNIRIDSCQTMMELLVNPEYQLKIIYRVNKPIGVILFHLVQREIEVILFYLRKEYFNDKYLLYLWREISSFCFDKANKISWDVIQTKEGLSLFLEKKLGFNSVGNNERNGCLTHSYEFSFNKWFEVSQIGQDTYAFLEKNQVLYFLLGQSKGLLINSGSGIEKIKPIIDKLTFFPVFVALSSISVNTIGNIDSFNKVYASENNISHLNIYPLNENLVKEQLCQYFQIKNELPNYHLPHFTSPIILRDNHQFNLGKRIVRAIYSPIYDKTCYTFIDDRGYLFSNNLISQNLDLRNCDLEEYIRVLNIYRDSKITAIYSSSSIEPLPISLIEDTYLAIKEIKSMYKSSNNHYTINGINIIY